MLPAGSYLITFTPSACPPNLTTGGGGGLSFEYIACSDAAWSELLEVTCPVSGDATNLSVDCTFTDDDGFCATTYHVQGNGTKTGNTWTITGTNTITAETPPGCSGDPTCEQMTITVVEQSSTPPSACQYGEANTIGTTVTGGPLGNVTMVAGGFPTAGAVGYAWDINAFYSSTGSFPAPAMAFNLSGMSMQVPEVAASSLPQSFPISILPPGAVQVVGGPEVSMSYNEQYTSGGGFFGEMASSGTLTVNEVSDKHIAGSYNVSMSGTQFTPPSSSGPSTRGVAGNFHVREVPAGTALRYPAWPGLAEAMKMSRQ